MSNKMHCINCEHVFDERDAVTQCEVERLSGRGPAYMYYTTCPDCGSDEIEELQEAQDEDDDQYHGT